MSKFWQFARMMLYYRRLLIYALFGALLDTLCVVGGFGTLTWIIEQFFHQNKTIQEIVADKINQMSPPMSEVLAPAAQWVPPGQVSGMAFAMGVILVLAIIGSLGRFMHEYNTITVTLRTVMRIRKMLFDRLVRMPMEAASIDGTAERISKIMRDCAQLTAGFNALTSRTVRGVMVGTALLILAFVIDWQLTSAFVLVVPPIAILIRKFGKRIRRASKRALRQYGVMLAAITESLQGLRIVKVHHAEGYERRRFATIHRRVLRQQLRARTARALSAPVIETLSMMGLMFVVLIAAWLVFEGDRERADLVSVLVMLVGSAGAFRMLTTFHNALQEAGAAAESIDEALHLPVEPSARQEHEAAIRRLQRHRRDICFENVTFVYPGSIEPALVNINLTVPQGKICAVVGANGSGKSTLLGLLPRLYEPTEGRVLIDGVDIATCTRRSVRRQMAMVTQETVLFDGTVADNLHYGSRHVSHERMIEAARRAHADEFINELPQGYDTPIGEGGMRLSGGQRQRIAIARAILRDPAILVLDEATSQVDADSEANIAAALADFMKNRTSFIIAHRLSTVIHADMIVVMLDGTIAAVGKHHELLRTSDTYRTLCRTQLHGMPAEAT